MSGDVDSFLTTFFGEANDLSVGNLRFSHPDLAQWLEGRIATVRAYPDGVHILPRRVGTETRWYGLAHSGRQLRELIEHFTAFVGPTYARIDHRAVTGPDSIDIAVEQFTDGHARVFDVLAGKQEQVRHAIELLENTSAQRPRRTMAMARPLGRLLREFDMAVLAAAEAASAALLAEIEQSGRVSAENLLFLRIRRLGGLRRYDELLAMPQLSTLLMMRRPAQVTAALFDAVYTTHLAVFETNADADGALATFADVVLAKYPALFKSRHGLQTSAAIKTYFLYSTFEQPADVATRDQLLGAPDLSHDERRYLAQFDRDAERPSVQSATLADAEAAARRGNFDIAFSVARDADSSIERAEVLLRCAVEMRTIEAITAAVSAVEELTDGERAVLTSSRWMSPLWEDVRSALAGPPSGAFEEAKTVPASWLEWFDRAVSDPRFEQAVAIAEHGSVEWAAADLTAEAGAAIHDTLNSDLDADALRTICRGLPSFLAYLERSGDIGRHHELVDDVATILLMSEAMGVADVQVLVGVIGILLETGVTATQYRQLVTDFLGLWADIDSPAQLDNGIELLDVLLTYSAPDPGARDQFFQALVGSVTRWRDWIKPAQWNVVIDLAGELGAAASISSLRTPITAEAQNVESLSRDALKGKTVAIYTLTEQAALRAKEFLNRHFDDVTVELANDHVATDRLGNLAQTADVFAVATRSAKHAATNHIQAQRPAHLPTVFAGGKGSTSLIRTILACVA